MRAVEECVAMRVDATPLSGGGQAFVPHSGLRLHGAMRCVEAGEIGEHEHPFGELVLVRQGRGVHRVRGWEYPLGPGDVFYVPVGHAHAYPDVDELHVMIFDFDPAIYLHQVQELTLMPGALGLFGPDWPPNLLYHGQKSVFCVHLQGEAWAQAESLAESLLRSCEHDSPERHTEVRAWFALLIVCLCRYYPEHVLPTGTRNVPLAKALAYIEDHYADALTLDALSGAACTSRSSLQRAFRKHLACTPMEYVMRRRIDRARELLLFTDMSMTAIGESTGFTDSNHFSRCFRRYAGESPRMYRNKNHALGPGVPINDM